MNDDELKQAYADVRAHLDDADDSLLKEKLQRLRELQSRQFERMREAFDRNIEQSAVEICAAFARTDELLQEYEIQR